jgi:sec-independent protein translocase protein TatA
MSLGGAEILVVLVLALLLFGPDKLPGLARQVGRGMREIRRATTEVHRQFNLSPMKNRPRANKRVLKSNQQRLSKTPKKRPPMHHGMTGVTTKTRHRPTLCTARKPMMLR